MARHQLPGKLVAFEGADGVGKTTQAKMAVDALNRQGIDAVFLFEPTRTSRWGIQLRESMQNGRCTPQEEFELFKLDRKFDVETNILPALQAGQVVCIDRYYISSMAYQGALGLSDLTPEFIRRENEVFAPEPDLLLYFHLPLDEALRRITATRGESLNTFELEDYQQRVHRIYATQVLDKFSNVRQIDAMPSPQDVSQNVLREILALFRCREK